MIRSDLRALWRFSAFRPQKIRTPPARSQFPVGLPLPFAQCGKTPHLRSARGEPPALSLGERSPGGSELRHSGPEVPPYRTRSDLRALWRISAFRHQRTRTPPAGPQFRTVPLAPGVQTGARPRPRPIPGRAQAQTPQVLSLAVISEPHWSLRRALVRRFGGVSLSNAVQPRSGQPRGPRRALRAAHSIIPYSARLSSAALYFSCGNACPSPDNTYAHQVPRAK